MMRWPPPGCAASRRARSRTAGWSCFLRTDPGPGEPDVRRTGEAADRAAGPASDGGQLAATPPAARDIFGPVIGAAERYAELLAGPGVERGLIGPAEAARLWDRHLMNCAVVAELVPRPGSLIDLGSGAGLPGIVLAMLLPDVEVVLLEPMARRVTFLEECVADLGLRNVAVHRGRAQDVAGRLTADVVTARAVAPLDRLAGLALGLVRPGGLVLAVKGAGAAREVAKASPVLRELGAVDVRIVLAGGGKVSPAATVVRFTAGPARAGGAAGGPRAGTMRASGAAMAGRRSGHVAGRRGGRRGGRRSPG